MPITGTGTGGDIPAVTAIYQHPVLHGTGTLEMDPPSESDTAVQGIKVLVRSLLPADGHNTGAHHDVP